MNEWDKAQDLVRDFVYNGDVDIETYENRQRLIAMAVENERTTLVYLRRHLARQQADRQGRVTV